MSDKAPTIPVGAAAFLQTFLPRSRCRALARGEAIPEQVSGACLFADISGFTPLTESLGNSLGPQQGAEVLTTIINDIFESLISQVYRFGGDVFGFAGDAITCWFAEPAPSDALFAMRCAAACALAMQGEMQQFAAVPTPDGKTHCLTMKVGISHGSQRRLLVGLPEQGLFDLLTGAAVLRMAAAEHHAEKGDIVCAPEVAAALQGADWGAEREGFRLLQNLDAPESPPGVQEGPGGLPLSLDVLRPFFPPALFVWLVRYSAASQARFLAELRPVVSAFVRFEGVDFENDPQVIEKLNQYIGTAQHLAAQYGGSVVRLDYGDKGAVMHVIFGAPVAHEQDGLRAVGWSVDMQNAVRQFPFITGQYIGMTRGQVYAGALGASVRRGYTLMGDEVNSSARLMQAAQPGQTLVSQHVMLTAQKRYMFHQFPGFQVKGKFEPVPVATPVAPLPPMPQMMPAGPMVGREREVAQMEEALNALMTGQGQVLRVEGDTGLGKTRLVAELVQKAMMRGVRTLLGNALSTSQTALYQPWREILNALFGLQPIWPAMQQAMQIQNMLQWINPEWIPRVPLLGDLLGLEIPDTPMTAGFDARMRRESLFALLGDLLERMAMQQPLLILIEDCHWADEASRALIEALALSLAGSRIMLVVTYRPGDDPDHPILPGLTAALHVNLQELSPAAVQALAAARLGAELPRDLLALIQERAQGNPLFVEELAETIRETSKLQSVGGHWQFASAGSAQKLPDTIQGVVLARLDRLEEDTRLTLSVASVAGRSFDVDLVCGVHPAQNEMQDEVQVIQDQMQALEQRNFIQQENPEPRLSYRFRQNVTQEVAYSTLLYAQRRELHRSVAEWYERVQVDSLSAIYPQLTHHYHRAGDAPKERHYAGLAGEMAAAQYANQDALAFFSRALELTPPEDWAARLKLLMQREKVYDLRAERELQAQDLAALESLAQQAGDARSKAGVALRQAHYAEVTGDYPQAVARLEQAVALSQSIQDTEGETAALMQWGGLLWLQGNYAAARPRLEETLAKAGQAGLPLLEADSARNLGLVFMNQGQYPAARQRFEHALEIYRRLGNRMGEAKSLSNLGIVHSHLDERAEARACYEQSLQLRRSAGDRMGESIALYELGLLRAEQRFPAEALKLYDEALEISRKIGSRRNEGIILNSVAYVHMLQGDYPSAQKALEQSLQIRRSLGNRPSEGYTLSSLGLLYYRTGEIQRVYEVSQQVLEIAKEVGEHLLEGAAHTLLGHSLTEMERLPEALQAYQQAAAIYRDLQQNNYLMEALAGLAKIYLETGQLGPALEQVEAILRHLETGSLEGTDEPLRVYLVSYQVLAAHQDGRAPEVIRRAHQMLVEQAEQIANPSMRQAFLDLALHRAILDVAAQVG